MAKTGAIKLAQFTEQTRLPQAAASAWSALEGLLGVGYKCIAYCGEQVVNGTNYWFLAERTLILQTPVRNVVKLAINAKPATADNPGGYELVKNSVVEIF